MRVRPPVTVGTKSHASSDSRFPPIDLMGLSTSVFDIKIHVKNWPFLTLNFFQTPSPRGALEGQFFRRTPRRVPPPPPSPARRAATLQDCAPPAPHKMLGIAAHRRWVPFGDAEPPGPVFRISVVVCTLQTSLSWEILCVKRATRYSKGQK